MQLLHEMGAQSVGLTTFCPWFQEALATNMSTGELANPPTCLWDRAAAAVRPGTHQATALSLAHHTLRRAAGELRAWRAAVVGAAAAAPGDVLAQAEMVFELEAILEKSRLVAVPVLVAMHTCLLTPVQLANIYVHCYPWCAGWSGSVCVRA